MSYDIEFKVRVADTDRLIEYCKGENFSLAKRRDIIDVSPAPSGQKLYISSARGWRDRDSLLTKLYAIDALEEKPWMIYGRDAASPVGHTKAEYIKASGGQYIDTGFMPNKRFVTIGDDAVNIDREWKEKIFDNRVYRFINDGDNIRLFGSGMEPIKIELSFSELVGEE